MAKSNKLPLIISLIALVVGVGLIAGILFLVTTFFRGSNDATGSYSAAVQTLESAQKSFVAGAVAQVGPYDVTTVSIDKGYTPSSTEADAIQKEFARAQRSTSSPNPTDYYGYSLTQETGQYALLTLNLKYNEARASYDRLQVSQGGWIDQFGSATLNEMVPLIVSPDVEDYQTSKRIITDAASASGATITLLYRVPKSETLFTLKYDIAIFTKVSPLVGTEGMPRKSYEYTIGIQ